MKRYYFIALAVSIVFINVRCTNALISASRTGDVEKYIKRSV